MNCEVLLPVNKRSSLLIVILILSAVIQLGSLFVLLKLKHDLNPDYRMFYEPVAQNILAGNGITDVRGHLATVYPPGYPGFLAASFFLADLTRIDRLEMVIILNILSSAMSCLFIFLIGELIFDKQIGFISSLLWMSYPFSLWLIKEPNSEVPFILFFYLGVWLFVLAIKQRWLPLMLMVGVSLALAALMRPIGLFLGVLFAFALLFYGGISRREKVIYAVLLLTGFVITVLPWELRVLSATGQLIPLSTNGAASILDGLTFAVSPGLGGDQANTPQDVMTLMQRIQSHRGTLQSANKIVAYMAREFRHNPESVIKLSALKLARSWYGTDAMWHEEVILEIQVIYLTTGLIGLVFAKLHYKGRNESVALIAGIILYFWAMTVLTKSILRYMVPAMGFLTILSAVAMDTVITRWGKRPRGEFVTQKL